MSGQGPDAPLPAEEGAVVEERLRDAVPAPRAGWRAELRRAVVREAARRPGPRPAGLWWRVAGLALPGAALLALAATRL